MSERTDGKPLEVPPPLAPEGFHAAMAHLYRGEMNRLTVWRQRLDVTSNWAILLSVGLTTFTLGSPQVPHYTLLLGLALVGISIILEGRRYRHLHHSKWRAYVMECGYFAELLRGRAPEATAGWREALAEDLRHPGYLLSVFTCMRARLRRNYLLLFYFITAVWVTKLFIHPQGPSSLEQFLDRLAVGSLVPWWFVATSAVVFVVGATLLAVTCPSNEALEDWSRWRFRLHSHQSNSSQRNQIG